MAASCFILGTGLVTAQGVGVAANWQRLLSGHVLHETGVVPLDRDASLPRVSQLAVHAATEAWTDAGRPPLADARTALVVGTSKGPVEDWIDQLDGRRPPDVTLGLARVVADVAAALGHAHGPRLTYGGACASGLHALIRATDLVRQGTCDQALVVAAEASTHALFVENFRRLGVLAKGEDGCRPYDANRAGFLLAEAAAAVWVGSRPARGVVRIEAAAALADAEHLTGVDPDGHALRQLLKHLAGPNIDLIHGHGTGTVQNDAAEYAALSARFIDGRPALYSHKHALGHTQGASGLIGVVLNAHMHSTQSVLGNTNSTRPMHTTDCNGIRLAIEPAQAKLNQSLVLASGFGGTLAGLRLRTHSDVRHQSELPELK